MRFLLVFLLIGCKTPPMAGTAGDEIDAFRASLADPAKMPVRKGLAVDVAPLRAAIDEFQVKHSALLEARYRASLDALPRSEMPSSPTFGMVVELPGDEMAGLAESTRMSWLLDPDATRLARMAMGMTLPILMTRTLGMATSDVAAWLAFLHAAKPAIGVCGRGAQDAAVCVDYGGLDVFVVKSASDTRGWHLVGLAWHQRGRAAPAK